MDPTTCYTFRRDAASRMNFDFYISRRARVEEAAEYEQQNLEERNEHEERVSQLEDLLKVHGCCGFVLKLMVSCQNPLTTIPCVKLLFKV